MRCLYKYVKKCRKADSFLDVASYKEVVMKKEEQSGLEKYSNTNRSKLPAKIYEQTTQLKVKVKVMTIEAKDIRPRVTQAKIDELLCRIREGGFL